MVEIKSKLNRERSSASVATLTATPCEMAVAAKFMLDVCGKYKLVIRSDAAEDDRHAIQDSAETEDV